MMGRAKVVLRILVAAAQVIAAVVMVAILGLVFGLVLSASSQPKELELVAVLAITMAAVIIASAITAFIHKAINPSDEATPPGVVFRESIKRYAWLAAPIASGYGIAQVISRVAEIVATGS